MSAQVAAEVGAQEGIPAQSGSRGPESGSGGPEVVLDDRLARAIGIPGFGLVIPQLTGLYGGFGAGDLGFWVGTLWFVGLAAAIWQGNRWLLFEQRRHTSWFAHPLRKITMLLVAIVLYTAPLTLAALLVWYRWAGMEVDWGAVKTVVLLNVICVTVVTHAYETAFLVKERAGDLLRVARLDRARAEAELAAFVAQVDPHFLFNSLNTLGQLAESDGRRAREFADGLAEVYRYLLRQRGKSRVDVAEELDFVRGYVALMQVRFGPRALDLRVSGDGEGRQLPPTGLQVLVENAIKHNSFDEERPLVVSIVLGEERATVSNARRPRLSARPSPGTGLARLRERVAIEVVVDAERFTVHLPLERA
jgi:hypothetical protein